MSSVKSQQYRDSESGTGSFDSLLTERYTFVNVTTDIFLSDITIGIILSGTAFLVEYFCDMWFESVELSKHYKTAIRVSFQLVAVIIALLLREGMQKLIQYLRGKSHIHVNFFTELFGLIIGAGFVITILFLIPRKN